MNVRRIPVLLLTIAGFPGMLATAAAQEHKNSGRTIWDGVYSPAQAERGKAVYLAKCGKCHEEDLSGYHAVLQSDHFMKQWRESSLEDFYTTVSTTMPRGAAGSLSEKVYVDIVAFILRANDFPDGPDELARGALRNIRVEGKTGPEEVQTGALVDVVGCLGQRPDHAWILTRATEPIRTRNPSDSTAEELKVWEVKPLGTHTYGLMDAVLYRPESQEGHKVEAKGLIVKGSGDDRINLTSLQMTDSKCGF